jgi:hypothetical protein
MAFICFCDVCKTDTLHYQNYCLKCKEREMKKEKEIFLDKRSKMTLEERVLLLESEYFDHKKDHPTKTILFA